MDIHSPLIEDIPPLPYDQEDAFNELCLSLHHITPEGVALSFFYDIETALLRFSNIYSVFPTEIQNAVYDGYGIQSHKL